MIMAQERKEGGKRGNEGGRSGVSSFRVRIIRYCIYRRKCIGEFSCYNEFKRFLN